MRPASGDGRSSAKPNFYGAMDGASRFVKGDAIAGILIILVNVVGGLSIGVGQHGMSWAKRCRLTRC